MVKGASRKCRELNLSIFPDGFQKEKLVDRATQFTWYEKGLNVGCGLTTYIAEARPNANRDVLHKCMPWGARRIFVKRLNDKRRHREPPWTAAMNRIPEAA